MASWRALRIGLCSGRTATLVPSRTRDVTAAATASVVVISRFRPIVARTASLVTTTGRRASV